jgi:hypothetical protein
MSKDGPPILIEVKHFPAGHPRVLSNADWKARVAEGLPPETVEEIPQELFGLITGLPAETSQFLGMALKSGLLSIRRVPGPYGAVDRGARRSRRRRHAF